MYDILQPITSHQHSVPTNTRWLIPLNYVLRVTRYRHGGKSVRMRTGGTQKSRANIYTTEREYVPSFNARPPRQHCPALLAQISLKKALADEGSQNNVIAESRILASFTKPNVFVPTQLLTLQDTKVRATKRNRIDHWHSGFPTVLQ